MASIISVQGFRIRALGQVALIVLSLSLLVDAEIERVESELDESSCLCGLDKDLIGKLESLAKFGASAQTGTCSAPNIGVDSLPGSQSHEHGVDYVPQKGQGGKNEEPEVDQVIAGGSDPAPTIVELDRPEVGDQTVGQTGLSVDGGLSSNQNQDEKTPPSQQSNIMDQLMAHIHQLEMQLLHLSGQSSSGVGGTSETTGNLQASLQLNKPQTATQSTVGIPVSIPAGDQLASSLAQTVVGQPGGFLEGIQTPDFSGALDKLNQSQPVNQAEMATALQSSIPSLVSNIFSNVQYLTMQAEFTNKHPMLSGSAHYEITGGGSLPSGSSSFSSSSVGSPLQTQEATNNPQLTSIDGQSSQLAPSATPNEIIAEGERLFLLWIERQLSMLNLSISAASYIRKSAVSLFAKILRQYVRQIERLGGALGANVRRATQSALNNTQALTSFLLRNYLNFAAGIMQIMGEQVSRVGKQLDSTGENIAHMSLNPFDIVSNVIDSLPNPSDYSRYFRQVGSKLFGTPINGQQQQQHQPSEQQVTDVQVQTRPLGLFSKTMGSLGKTFSGWMNTGRK